MCIIQYTILFLFEKFFLKTVIKHSIFLSVNTMNVDYAVVFMLIRQP